MNFKYFISKKSNCMHFIVLVVKGVNVQMLSYWIKVIFIILGSSILMKFVSKRNDNK